MKIYTSNNCPNCKLLKQVLTKKNKQFEEVDATSIKVVAFLRARKLPMQLPIVEEEGRFFTFDQYKEVMK